jgi:hypothetical protein
MTPPFQAVFACAVAPARYARLRSSTRWSYPIYRNNITLTFFVEMLNKKFQLYLCHVLKEDRRGPPC